MELMPTAESRREHDRLDFDADVTLQIGDRTVAGTCRNISQGGMFVETAEVLVMDQTVRVRFTLPDLRGKEVDAEAHVRWIGRESSVQSGVGLQFVGLRPIEVWAINQLFRKRSRGT